MKILLIIVAIIVVLFAGFYIYLNSGSYNIAATSKHTGTTLWMIDKLVDNSIEKHASDIDVPENLGDSSVIAAGFGHFDENCRECHGAAGFSAEEFAKGLYPEAPELKEEIEEWSPAELFWITKHGIKMTGMPAFAPTHTDQQIWQIVAFMQFYEHMSAAEYKSMMETAGEEYEGYEEGEHDHEEPEAHESD